MELWLEIRWGEVPSSIPERKATRNLTIHKIKTDEGQEILRRGGDAYERSYLRTFWV